jgi:hypothetical protein
MLEYSRSFQLKATLAFAPFFKEGFTEKVRRFKGFMLRKLGHPPHVEEGHEFHDMIPYAEIFLYIKFQGRNAAFLIHSDLKAMCGILEFPTGNVSAFVGERFEVAFEICAGTAFKDQVSLKFRDGQGPFQGGRGLLLSQGTAIDMRSFKFPEAGPSFEKRQLIKKETQAHEGWGDEPLRFF